MPLQCPRFRLSKFLPAGATALLVAIATSAGAVQRTFVHSSPLGNDGNAALSPPCTQAAPCRTFAVAIGVTDPAGEIVALDTAGYGGLTITKSIKILAPGVYGGITVGGATGMTTGIVINAGDTDDITLRGLDISGLTTVPLPLIGIDIQNAGAVHIEKTSVGNFTQDTSACINVNVAKTTRVYVVDSFLRECNISLYANGSVAVSNRPSVLVDNTRIERGRNTGGTGGLTRGVWLQGFMDVSLRNSMISRQDVGIQFDNLLAGSVSHLEVINSELSRDTTGLLFASTTANAAGQISFLGSQIVGTTDVMLVSNTAAGSNPVVKLTDTYVAYASNSGIQVSNSAADANSRILLELVRSQVSNTTNTAIDLSATNGCQVLLDMRDSALSGTTTLLKTSGSGSLINASIVRSQLHQATTAIDHGQGNVQLDSTHVNYNLNDFVNNGSGNIVSNGQNMLWNNINGSGFTYITPAVIPLK